MSTLQFVWGVAMFVVGRVAGRRRMPNGAVQILDAQLARDPRFVEDVAAAVRASYLRERAGV